MKRDGGGHQDKKKEESNTHLVAPAGFRRAEERSNPILPTFRWILTTLGLIKKCSHKTQGSYLLQCSCSNDQTL